MGLEGEGSEEGAGAAGRLLVCRRGSAAAEVAWGALRDFLDSGLGASKEGGLTLQVRRDRALREGAQPLGAVCEARRRAREVQCCCLDWGIMSGMGRARRSAGRSDRGVTLTGAVPLRAGGAGHLPAGLQAATGRAACG